MKDRNRFLLVICLGLSLFVSCMPFQPPPLTDAPGALPPTYSLYGGQGATAWPWWQAVGSPELNRLVDEALTGSFTLGEAAARLRQVRALALQVNPDLRPSDIRRLLVETARRTEAGPIVDPALFIARAR